MADYNGTDEDDIIDASELASDIGNIYPGEGNDTITNATSLHTIVSSPGEDTISGENTNYALWQATQSVTINLKEGWSEDGFGGRDSISGIETVHGTRFGDTFYGTENYEKFFANGGNNTIDGGGGSDRVSYAPGRGASTDYEISYVDGSIHVKGENTLDIIKNVSTIEFMDDSKIIDATFFSNPIKAKLTYTSYKFYDDTIAPEYTYAGVTTEAQLVSWFAQGGALLDLNEDGSKDVIIPISKGYASGIDGRTPFIALTTEAGKLIYDEEINAYMPNITSSRRTEAIQLVNSETESIVSAHHDTEEESKRNDPDRKVPYSELTIISTMNSDIKHTDIIPRLPMGTDNQPYAVDAHSMAVGDINGDGLDDIFVGEMSIPPYALMQQDDGNFTIVKNDFYASLKNTSSLLLDSALVDINNDGFNDLIAGFGHGDNSVSKIYINNEGEFSENIFINLPNSKYGSGNQLHMKTMPYDFDNDGDIDLAVQWSRNEPYYGGQYIQILMNDGEGNLTDNTDKIIGGAYEDAYMSRLQWSEPWQLIDLNNDNHMDIAGTRATNDIPIFYLNDGKGVFEIIDVARDQSVGKAYSFSDFDKDNKIEFVTFYSTWSKSENGKGTETEISLNVYELTNEIGTGPDYSIKTAEQGVPGFNERYYLNENISAKEAIDAGTYATGLEHYLAEGKDTGLKSFAPFTKVHGYSGDDTIVLREGDETAFGYAGKDTIEGGAGNDIIDGGTGLDSAIYKDSSSAYTLTANDDGTVSVVHSSPSEGFTDEGSDTLTGIEKIQFSDKILSKTSLKYELSETIDSSENILSAHTENVLSGTLNFNKGNNIIILDGQGKTYRGLEGDDTYFVSQLLPKNGKVSITDTEGSNTIQLPSNTYVDKSLFTKNAARLTLEDGREITISGADKFSYNVGGNITKGDKGTDLTFTEFAEVFGAYDILNSSSAQNGEISDMYII
tara:strand:+ start:287 stop:3151 length:2865 start_codon:yes stop_codon:yes gene_type:complete